METRSIDLIVIAGSVYRIDKKNSAIFPLGRQGKPIREKEMQQSGTFCSISFDIEKMEPVPDRNRVPSGGAPITLRLPRQCFDPIRFPKPEEIAFFNNLSKRDGWGVTFLAPQLVDRINGKLPQIDLAGIRYGFDIENRRFISRSGLYADLSMSAMELLSDGSSLAFVYNRESRQVVDIERGVKDSSPGETFFVEIGDLFAVDPVGMSKQLGMNEGYFITPDLDYSELYLAKATPLAELVAIDRRPGLQDSTYRPDFGDSSVIKRTSDLRWNR